MKLLVTLAIAALAIAVPAGAEEVQDWSAPDSVHMVEVEGGRVWVRVNGDLEAAALPAIFIHGGPGGTHDVFGGLISMADERAVILYDQLDSGMSDRPEDPANWRVERFVGELEAIRQALGVERWHVVGHSWGAALALEYAAAYPQHTASAVLAGTYISTAHWIIGTNLLIGDLPDATAAAIRTCIAGGTPEGMTCEEADRTFYANFNGRPDRPASTPERQAYLRAYSGKGWNPKVYNAMWGPTEYVATGSLSTYDATPLLTRTEGERILFMVGQYDEAQLDQVLDFVRLTPGSELAVVPGGSHSSFGERPYETEAILRARLGRKDPPQRDGQE
jgi:proline iminopeptidase/L-proline amide hydrolase